MVTYDRLVFSEQAFKDKMFELIDDSLNAAVARIMTNEYFTGSVAKENSMTGFDKYLEIPTTDIKAWVVEYGQGAEAEFWRNPYWKEYVESKYTHSDRLKDPSVLKRGRERYESIDFDHGKIRDHKEGGAEPAGTKVSDGLQKALSVDAHPFLERLLDAAWKDFLATFEQGLQTFNLGSCFLTVTEHV